MEGVGVAVAAHSAFEQVVGSAGNGDQGFVVLDRCVPAAVAAQLERVASVADEADRCRVAVYGHVAGEGRVGSGCWCRRISEDGDIFDSHRCVRSGHAVGVANRDGVARNEQTVRSGLELPHAIHRVEVRVEGKQ